MTPITEEMRQAFDERTKEHIDRVLYFGNILGFDFSGHDSSKWDADKIDGFILSNAATNMGLKLDADDLKIRETAVFYHIKSEPHHPSYWDDNITIDNYTMNPKGFGNKGEFDNTFVIDATKMDKRSMVEMCADWCAVSDELNTNPHDWADANVGTRWKFTDDQKNFLNNTLEVLWMAHQINKSRDSSTENDEIDFNMLVRCKKGRG